jgi:hypothetical protein
VAVDAEASDGDEQDAGHRLARILDDPPDVVVAAGDHGRAVHIGCKE